MTPKQVAQSWRKAVKVAEQVLAHRIEVYGPNSPQADGARQLVASKRAEVTKWEGRS